MTTSPQGTRESSTPQQDEGRQADEGISLEEITVAFPRNGLPDLMIVEGLNIRIGPGAMVCLAGRSGSGKTSVLKVAAGLAEPSAGRVRWWGTDISTLGEDDRRMRRRARIGYADQSGTMVQTLTALENVMLPCLPDGRSGVRARRDRARDLLTMLGVGDRAGYRPNVLSGGERSRVALARAMVMAPGILIVDEPTAGLDRLAADGVIAVLAEHAHSGGGVLVASHDPHAAEAADVVVPLEADGGGGRQRSGSGAPGRGLASAPEAGRG